METFKSKIKYITSFFNKNFIKTFLLFILITCAYIFSPVVVSAATLSISPSTGIYSVGSSITVNILVSSTDKAMNAASGLLSFPVDLLSVSSVSKVGSIVDLWAQDPSFSNVAGTVNFESVLLPPGFTGSSGKILSVTFKAKSSGTANITFTSGSVLAADGMGTDILTFSGSASFDIEGVAQSEPVITTPKQIANAPAAPEISSTTHPDQTKWYTTTDATFSWGLPKDVVGANILMGRIEKSTPTVLYDPPISSKEVSGLQDGIWYFHVQLKNGKGWSLVSNYKIQIDTEKPTSFDITEVERSDLTDPKAKFVFNATDKTSGIDHYEIQIDNGTVTTWKDDGSKTYETPAQDGGTHTLFVKAVDKAGNFLANSVSFAIQSLDAPTITDYTNEIQNNEAISVSGTTKYFNSQAILYVQDEKGIIKKYLSNVDKEGNFTIITSDKFKEGTYTAWVIITDGRDAKSSSSEKLTITATQSAFIRIGSWAISFLAVLTPLIALVLLLTFLLWYGWHKFSITGKKLKKEVREAEDSIHKAFDLLKESVQEQLKILEKVKSKRRLTEEEEKVNKQLRKDLDDAERYIRKEMKDIEDLVNK